MVNRGLAGGSNHVSDKANAGENEPFDSRLERAIATIRQQAKEWQATRKFGRIGFEVDVEAGVVIVARLTTVQSVK